MKVRLIASQDQAFKVFSLLAPVDASEVEILLCKPAVLSQEGQLRLGLSDGGAAGLREIVLFAGRGRGPGGGRTQEDEDLGSDVAAVFEH